MRRGRPPYPGVLTPREQEVLALLRDGLTNDQIAARLGISESGARYHVSEILSKLGVASRHEAAQWRAPEALPRRWAPALTGKLSFAGKLGAAALIGGTLVGLVALAAGVVVSRDRAASPRIPVVETLAGTNETSGVQGPFFSYRDGQASQAIFDRPVDVAVDQDGNVYVADQGSGRLRVIRPNGTVESLQGPGVVEIPERAPGLPPLPGMPPAGTYSGFFHQLATIDVDRQGNVFIAGMDSRLYRLESNGDYSVIAGGEPPPRTAPFTEGPFGDFKNLPLLGPADAVNVHGTSGIAALPDGSLLLVGDSQNALQGRNQMVRKLTPDGQMALLAGSEVAGFRDGSGNEARFDTLIDVAVDGDGNAYVTDKGNFRVRKIAPNGEVSTLAGSGQSGFRDGRGAEARFRDLRGIAIGPDGTVFVTDSGAVRSISRDGVVTTIAGAGNAASPVAPGYVDGPANLARFNHPLGLAVDGNGNVVLADSENNLIRRIEFTSGSPSLPVVDPVEASVGNDELVSVYVYADASVPGDAACIDHLADMVPVSAAQVAPKRLATCRTDSSFLLGYQLVQNEDGLALRGAKLWMLTTIDRNDLANYPVDVRCLEIRDKLLTADVAPTADTSSINCVLEPPIRGNTSDPLTVWVYIPTRGLPGTPLPAGIECWTLGRYNSPGSEGTVATVPCVITNP